MTILEVGHHFANDRPRGRRRQPKQQESQMSVFKRFVRALASSKKAVASVATAVVALAAPTLRKLGVDITPDQVEQVIVIGTAYVLGQGVADHGKEAAKARAQGATPASTSTAGFYGVE